MRYLAVFLLVTALSVEAQTLTQTVRGTIVEQETQFPLIGASVILTSSTELVGATADINGQFRLDNVPLGRQSFKISFIGFEDVYLSNIIVTSGKEVILNVSMEESATQLESVVVTATQGGEAINEMALVSTRSFSVEETDRYAGSRGDPARMASNFAGVLGADDSRNDIVIRGNSPQAVLWRVEGINIPNPNHFNIPGTAGGPASMLNNKNLANSDFYTGAFPAEFGNSIAGVFDLNMRNGNNSEYEFSGQFGFLGTELFAEGPISRKNRSSFIASYRYSTLALFEDLNIDLGTSAVPFYQDAAFKFNFPLKNNGSISLFGIGGNSAIDIKISDQITPDREFYGQNDRDQYFTTKAGFVGAAYKQPLSKSTYVSATTALSSESVHAYHEFIFRHVNAQDNYELDSLWNMLDYTFTTNKWSTNLFLAHKKGTNDVINVGLNADMYFINVIDSVREIAPTRPNYGNWTTRWDSDASGLLLQPFVQWKHEFGSDLKMTLGVHSQYFSLSKSFVPFEPRFAIKYEKGANVFEFGTGLHSQIQPIYMYFYGTSRDSNGTPIPDNLEMDFSRSLQIVGGYQRIIGSNIRVKSEVYYQHLFNIPVEAQPSSFSLVNTGAGFSRFFPNPLVNEGVGRNFGTELTVEKYFSNGYMFLLTGALFDAKYQGSDGIWRDTDFNGNYVANGLFTKEFKIKERNTLALGTKLTTAGGRRYGPVDRAASELEKEVIYVDSERNSLQFKPYFRADLKINYRVNLKRVTHEIAFDLVNLLDTQNILSLTYAPNEFDPTANPVRENYQLGFLPLFYYKVDF
ncbi:MAG: TonB-dependent receptor [Cyclobacteriaceae bacterium]